MIHKFHKYSFLAMVLLGNWVLGCSSYPQRLIIKDTLTGLRVNSVLLVMELRGDYDVSDYNPMARVYRQDRIDRYRKKYKVYGHGRGRKHSFGPGFYYNYDYLSQLPFAPPIPDQVQMEIINSGWKIFIEELPRDNEATYSVTKYYLFKQGYLPILISASSMKMLTRRRGNVNIGFGPIVTGTFASDWQIIRMTKSILAMSQLPHLKPSPVIQKRLLAILADSLAKITALPCDPEPYPDFTANQAEARKLLEHLQQAAPIVTPMMDE